MVSREDRVQRRHADAIARGCPVNHEAGPPAVKTVAYGLVRPLVNEDGVLEGLKDGLRDFNGDSIDALVRASSSVLADQLYPMRHRPGSRVISCLFDTLNQNRGREASPEALLGRFDSAIGGSMFAEGVTLRTLRRHTANGGVLSRAALYESARVPVSLATQYSAGATSPLDHGLTEFPEDPIAGNDYGPVFRGSTYAIDPNRGLDLTTDPISYPSESGEPYLGCPFRRIAELHQILADVAVNQQIITLVD